MVMQQVISPARYNATRTGYLAQHIRTGCIHVIDFRHTLTI